MSDIPLSLRHLVIERAGNRCEYCRLAQAGQEAAFHMDHVLPRVDGGETTAENLALACVSCSLRKAARRTATDPETNRDVPLYDPRKHSWELHFRWEDAIVIGTSPSGRATVEALQMNRSSIVAIRVEESLRGRHPPSER